MEMIVGGGYSMWKFLELIRKRIEFARVINMKTTQFRGSLFGLGIFSRGVTYFSGITLAINFNFPEFLRQI